MPGRISVIDLTDISNALTKPRLRNKFLVDVSVLAKKFQNFWKLRLEKDCKKVQIKNV